MPRDPRAYLFDIAAAAGLIRQFVGTRDFEAFAGDALVQSGVERQFEIIGEALSQLRRLDPALAAAIREHQRIIGFRNLLIHGYAEVDESVVWSIVSEKLPWLVADVQALQARLGD